MTTDLNGTGSLFPSVPGTRRRSNRTAERYARRSASVPTARSMYTVPWTTTLRQSKSPFTSSISRAAHGWCARVSSFEPGAVRKTSAPLVWM
jgi:hypothetical protein